MENSTNNTAQGQTGTNGFMGKATSWFENVDMNKVPDSLKQYGTTAADTVKSMSTTQKVLGGAIIAAGAWYLSSRSKNNFKMNAAHAARETE
ncbi:hypothetical protein [Adhaeribacter aquaticus]|uniref:hypothetical protein n=1 Tax=Adhaeribacter aquaticus TaxID=299567 RepID=UPI000478A040|nr:hypothetical protein [Adhaeribacter aquaticus]